MPVGPEWHEHGRYEAADGDRCALMECDGLWVMMWSYAPPHGPQIVSYGPDREAATLVYHRARRWAKREAPLAYDRPSCFSASGAPCGFGACREDDARTAAANDLMAIDQELGLYPEPVANGTVREIRHEVRVDLPADMRPMKTFTGRRRKPVGLRLQYGVTQGVTRVDITVEFHNAAELFPPVMTMPAWMREIVNRHRPADVDNPLPDRRTGMGGWPLGMETR
jgi:hypothetical protein